MSSTYTEPVNYYAQTSNMIEKCAQLNEKIMKKLLESQLSYAVLWSECINNQIQRLSNVKNPDDLFSIESGLVSEYAEMFSENMRQDLDTLTKTQAEFMDELFKGNNNPFSSLVMQSQEITGRDARRKKGNSGRKTTEKYITAE